MFGFGFESVPMPMPMPMVWYWYVCKLPCMTRHMTVKYIMMYPSMVGSVQCDVITKGCLLCVCACVYF